MGHPLQLNVRSDVTERLMVCSGGHQPRLRRALRGTRPSRASVFLTQWPGELGRSHGVTLACARHMPMT